MGQTRRCTNKLYENDKKKNNYEFDKLSIGIIQVLMYSMQVEM